MKIINVMAVSLDGSIAVSHDEKDKVRYEYGFVSKEDKEFVKSQLLEADAVICGANTMKASQRIWEVKNYKERFPEWYVFTENGLPENLGFWKQENISRFIVSKYPQEVSKISTTVQNLNYHKESPARFIHHYLSQRNDIEKVLLFGGGYINQLFYEENLVDELKVTICPIILGANHAARFVNPPLSQFVKLQLTSSKSIGNHVFLNYTINRM